MTSSRDTPSGSRKAAAEIYRKAAQRIEQESDYACCYALSNVGAAQEDVERMRELFCEKREPNRWGGHWMVEHGEEKYGGSEEIQNRRVLALCFMASITERP